VNSESFHLFHGTTCSGITRGEGGPPRVTRSRGWHQKEKIILCANLQKIVDKRGGTGKKGAEWPFRGWHLSEINKSDSDEQKRSSVFRRKNSGETPRTGTWWRLKKVKEKIGVIPSVATPGDTHPRIVIVVVVVMMTVTLIVAEGRRRHSRRMMMCFVVWKMLTTLNHEMWNQRRKISGTGKTRKKKTPPMYGLLLNSPEIRCSLFRVVKW